MNNDGIVADANARERGLDVGRSFIVRAPAGSGKTRLLIQRYLALLACANEPEEVIAITFTRKAAAEMRARVRAAFSSVGRPGTQADGVDTFTVTLARRALDRDAQRGWRLVANTQRLRIMTIDAFNASLTRQMSMTSRFGAQPESLDDASALYRQAAHSLLAIVHQVADNAHDHDLVNDVSTLLAHLDNNLSVLEELVAAMLRSRDHWLRNLPRMHERETLEAALDRVRVRAVAAVAALYPMQLTDETLALMRFSGQNLLKEGVDHALSTCADLAAFPGREMDALPAWLALAEMLLTKDGGWRKVGGVNRKIGFPTSTNKEEKALLGAMKARLGTLLDALTADPDAAAALADALLRLRTLPPAGYSDAQWRVLGAIVRLLPQATAILWSEFSSAGQCDFTEIAQAASRALGADDAPTDLALALDYRVQHLLVDEFQDTSFAQFELLEKLTRGWAAGDGRTLFVVGDPMQSIYRFREAEVGLFLQATSSGIGGVELEPVTLSVNFRSDASIVDWVNHSFQQLMSSTEVAAAGVVPYSPSEAFAGDGSPAAVGVSLNWNVRRNNTADADGEIVDGAMEGALTEARRIVGLIRQSQQRQPLATIAILVRNRSHLRAIVPLLNAEAIAYHAVDIDPLKHRPVVQDLLALTRALMHLADRIAWLAILRAPWCGMSLKDLGVLVGGELPVNGTLVADPRTIWELVNDEARLDALSDDGATRLRRLRETLAHAIALRRLLPLRDAVERTWWALAGPACLQETNDLADANTFLDLVESEAMNQTNGGQLIDLELLEARVDRLYAGSQSASKEGVDIPVQIMTIHKAKGLEFDSVIVPGLERAPRHDDKRLMLWTEQPNPETGDRELLLAPIRQAGIDDETDEIYRYIAQLEREKQRQEDVRLLYVAATRARSALHLFASVTLKQTSDGPQVVAPRAGSLLASLWPALSPPAAVELMASDVELRRAVIAPRADHVMPGPRRLRRGVPQVTLAAAVMVEPRAEKAAQGASRETAGQVDFDWAGDTARYVGTVVHVLLQRIADEGVDRWDANRVSVARGVFLQELARRGVAAEALEEAASSISRALAQTIEDPRGRWILQRHVAAKSEWRLTGMVGDALINAVIDRTFVDESGVRWIIDFKTGGHQGADVDAFLDSEQRRYRNQLESYAELIKQSDAAHVPSSVRLGLYFPLLRGWREWASPGVA